MSPRHEKRRTAATHKRIGILTAGGDSSGLSAAIRGFGTTAIGHYGWDLIGYRDEITGLVDNHHTPLDGAALSGILTVGGTILGTSRDKVHKFRGDTIRRRSRSSYGDVR